MPRTPIPSAATLSRPVRFVPGRGAVSEAVYQSKVNPDPIPPPDQLRRDALSLYRRILRTIRHAPPSNVREDSYKHARGEFERNREAQDPHRIEWLIRSGTNEFLAFGHYFDQARHFTTTTVTKRDPQQRARMLEQLRKISTTATLPAVEKELRRARELAVKEPFWEAPSREKAKRIGKLERLGNAYWEPSPGVERWSPFGVMRTDAHKKHKPTLPLKELRMLQQGQVPDGQTPVPQEKDESLSPWESLKRWSDKGDSTKSGKPR